MTMVWGWVMLRFGTSAVAAVAVLVVVVVVAVVGDEGVSQGIVLGPSVRTQAPSVARRVESWA